MSFILDSIKKAERERKLGQQVPSISIEYSGEHIADEGINRQQWTVFLLGMLITAALVWGATYYFAQRDRVYAQQISEHKVQDVEKNVVEQINAEADVREVEIIPMRNMHQSELKIVKVISEEDRVYEPQVEKQIKNSQLNNTVADKVVPENAIMKEESKPVYEIKPVVVKESNVQEAKQELAAIYSDLAKLSPEQINVEQSVQIEPAHYVAPSAKPSNSDDKSLVSNDAGVNAGHHQEVQVNHVTNEQAVNTGLPSFGELPYDVQEKIPDFDVSVHMFHADPNQRRIRINGNMYTEGKRLQQDLALVEITRYGAVFDYQGHLFRYNVR